MPNDRPCPIHRVLVSRDAWASPRNLILLALLLITSAHAQIPPEPATVRIGVLSLFHPKALVLASARITLVSLDGDPVNLTPEHHAMLSARGDQVYFNNLSEGFSTGAGGDAYVHTVTLPSQTFTLTVPGKLTRTYRGALTVTAHDGVLIPVVTMDTELAVASIVAAESPPHAPLEALKAQAVAARSFLLANPHPHAAFDACDTTHCQFLRSPPASGSPAGQATQATRNTVLIWRGSPDASPRIVAAMYARSCGGQTRALANAPSGAYPFYSVRCEYCLRHPELWSRPHTAATATEQQRLAFNRIHGWSAIPSNTAVADGSMLEGRGTGHGLGLCQLGASDLAARGATFQQILAHYYPNTFLTSLP